MFFIGFTYPFLTLAYLFSPKSYLGKFSHYPRVAYTCEAASEIYYLIMILIYPYVIDSKKSYLIYNIFLTIITIAKINKEGQEIFRRTWKFYIRDLYNVIDWVEILFMIIIVICRFIDLKYQTSDFYDEIETYQYKTPTIIADGLFVWLPIFITMRMLLLFRVFRGIGLLQISFTKMFDDIFAWIGILITIIVGFSIGFNLLGEALLHQNDGNCEGTIFERMSDHLGNSLWEVSWVMFTGPDPDDLKDLRACYEFNWFIHVVAYLLTAILSLMIVVVLVNLLIAMMSKTFDKVCDDEVREIEWTFNMMNLNVKFIRRDFVAPIPMNLNLHYYKHFISEHAFWRKVFRKNDSNASDTLDNQKWVDPTHYSNSIEAYKGNLNKNFILELSQGEIQRRNEAYDELVDKLVQRYRRKWM